MIYKLYDMERRFDLIDEITDGIEDDDLKFDIKLILSEAILNANEHAHQFNDFKAITISVENNDGFMEFTLQDEDPLIKNYRIKETISDSDILKESGRGLFLISQLADHVELRDNKLVIRKEVAYIAK